MVGARGFEPQLREANASPARIGPVSASECKSDGFTTSAACRSSVRIDYEVDVYTVDDTKWSGREDSNLRPLVPKTSALARLSYAPKRYEGQTVTVLAGRIKGGRGFFVELYPGI